MTHTLIKHKFVVITHVTSHGLKQLARVFGVLRDEKKEVLVHQSRIVNTPHTHAAFLYFNKRVSGPYNLEPFFYHGKYIMYIILRIIMTALKNSNCFFNSIVTFNVIGYGLLFTIYYLTATQCHGLGNVSRPCVE